ncbi:sensor histidine kinase [Amycolatopsis nigrescens]|uniref:sensor histidine kinase n=1 Tax=Amycolatopsis nigrescens TaxID=381445 RepID=UPI000377FA33|nr:histidine kinase [Amycolatopsis nigrescens]
MARDRCWDAGARRLSTLWFGLQLCGFSFITMLLAALTLLSMVGMFFGLASMTTAVIETSRQLTETYRRGLLDWTGVRIESPYLPVQPARRATTLLDPGMAHERRRLSILLKDQATWRDLLWMVLTPVTGVLFGLLPFVVAGYGLVFLAGPGLAVLITGSDRARPDTLGQILLHPTAALGDLVWTAVPAGLAAAAIVLAAAGPLLRGQVIPGRLLLGPTAQARLARRVTQLTETRAHATDTQAAELRRIERDLHDGAQARMVAVGITLRTLEHALETDPAAARELAVEARETAAAALEDLRSLVRGVHPPVLAERGLADAIRAVALDAPLEVGVQAELPAAVEAPIEAAVYFAVCELLANVAKHSGAERASISLSHREDQLDVVVRDEGRGGVDPLRGSGLRGIAHRISTFDGTLELDSPPGGPTVVTLAVPCALGAGDAGA